MQSDTAQSRSWASSPLPIDEVLGTLRTTLATHESVILEAEPGAGKTTRVPLALLGEPWLAGRRMLLLEPRRVAARLAAERMAQLLGEQPGASVGYRMRYESRVGPSTRLEVVTEGVLTRMLQQDPSLEGVGLVIFDEYHERSLVADLGLALTLQGRSLFRSGPGAVSLKVLLMSATLDGESLAKLLGGAPRIRCQGRTHPVELIHGEPYRSGGSPVEPVTALIRRALAENPEGDLLVFLPGRFEIDRVEAQLQSRSLEPQARVIALHGGLSLAEQQRALEPLASGRKVILATNIAETSLTIPGVRVVIDSGLVRESRFDPRVGMARLETCRITRPSSVQRAGRAGRTSPGRCYRAWSEHQQQELSPTARPEILQADLAPLALDLIRWGIDDPSQLCWLDPPPAGAFRQALDLLVELRALQPSGAGFRLTPRGEAMADLPVHPRLGAMLLVSRELERSRLGAEVAALLTEQRPPRSSRCADLEQLLTDLRLGRLDRAWSKRVRDLAKRLEGGRARDAEPAVADPSTLALLVASAYPDRVARCHQPGQYRLANGRLARLDPGEALGNREWLAVAEVGGKEGQATDIIRLAVALDPRCFDRELASLVRTEDRVDWEGVWTLERCRLVGAILLTSRRLGAVPVDRKRAHLESLLARQGLDLLGWSPAAVQLRGRMRLMHDLDATWPDVGDAALRQRLPELLEPGLDAVNRREELRRLDVFRALRAMLSGRQQAELDALLPTHWTAPSGSRIALDYQAAQPVLAVRLQEMFGLADTPRIAGGRVVLLVHLLSPAGRPLQITSDLAGFWRQGYAEVRRATRGRYPKHAWPEDPLQASPHRGAKPKPPGRSSH